MPFQSQTGKLREEKSFSLEKRNQFHSFSPFETNMKSAVQLIVLLACIFLYTSGNPIMNCRCIKTIPAVRRHLIVKVEVYEPSPACGKREVIAIMKDNIQRCLDPESNFTKNFLQSKATTTTTTTAATTKSAATSSSVTRQRH